MSKHARPTVVLIDGNSIALAMRFMGTPTTQENDLDYVKLGRYIQEKANVVEVIYYQSHRNRVHQDKDAQLHTLLHHLGYVLNVNFFTPSDAALALLYKLRDLEDQPQDVFFVGGNFAFFDDKNANDSRNIGEVLLDLSALRRVAVVYFDPATVERHLSPATQQVLESNSIEFHDLMRDVGAVSQRKYGRLQNV